MRHKRRRVRRSVLILGLDFWTTCCMRLPNMRGGVWRLIVGGICIVSLSSMTAGCEEMGVMRDLECEGGVEERREEGLRLTRLSSRRPPHRRRCLHRPRHRLQDRPRSANRPGPLRIGTRSSRRGAVSRRRRPLQPSIRGCEAPLHPRENRRPEHRDDSPLLPVLCRSGARHAAREPVMGRKQPPHC